MRAHWPLLTKLDDLLALQRWQEDIEAIVAMERRIGIETNTLIVLLRALDLVYPIRVDRGDFDDEDPPPPFLRSRDAAALLEDAVAAVGSSDFVSIDLSVCPLGHDPQEAHAQAAWNDCGGVWMTRAPDGSSWISIGGCNAEPAARTRAALEAGWRLGLWPAT